MTLSLAAVFIPVLFMGGISAGCSTNSPSPSASAILISGFVSRHADADAVQPLPQAAARSTIRPFIGPSERVFDGMARRLRLDAPRRDAPSRTCMLVAFGDAGGDRRIYCMIVPKGFIPSQDTDTSERQPGPRQDISFDEMRQQQRERSPILVAKTLTCELSSSWARAAVQTAHQPRPFQIQLKPRNKRKSVRDRSSSSSARSCAVPGSRRLLANPPIGSASAASEPNSITVHVAGCRHRDALQWARISRREMRKLPDCTDVNSDLQIASPQVSVNIDRDRASAFGLTATKSKARSTTLTATGRSPPFTRKSTATEVMLEVDAAVSANDLTRLEHALRALNATASWFRSNRR